MSRFNSSPSDAYRSAVTALKALPFEERHRAYADATAEELEQSATEQLGKPTRGKRSWRRVVGGAGRSGDQMPADDHTELRSKDGVSTYVSQPTVCI